MFPFRKYSSIAFLVICFFLTVVHVDAHCYFPNGDVDLEAEGCHPTISPAPTDKPSAEPTDAPTESPAPSPSPSAVPSASPTTSTSPSMSPTSAPSEHPSQNPTTTTSPSASPTGPILLTVVDIEIAFQNVTGEREMSPPEVNYFEEKTTSYLQKEIQQAPGVSRIEVENVIVTDQNLVVQESGDRNLSEDLLLRKPRRLGETQTHLLITVDVIATVVLNRSESLRLNAFFEEFFEIPEHKQELRGILASENSFAQGIFIKGEISSSKASVKKASNGKTVTGAILGVVALIVGSGLLWMWVQTRQIIVLQSSDSRKIENQGTISKSFESEDGKVAISSFNCRIETDDANTNNSSRPEYSSNENDEDNQSNLSRSQLMYIPTLMPTESNIEVPDTPMTEFAINGFATPMSANGGLMTPSSVKSTLVRDNSIVVPPRLLDEKSPYEMASSKSTKKKILLPPKILGPLKSPFRREQKADDNLESRNDLEYDESYISGAGIVAGKHNARPSEDKGKKKKAPRDFPPSEIGGPGITSYGARPIVVPVEENASSKTQKDRQNSKHSRSSRPCPPMVIGGPSEKGSHVEKSANTKDYGVDIVDEIAYLYSTTSEPKGLDVEKSANNKDYGVDIVDEIAYLYSTKSGSLKH